MQLNPNGESNATADLEPACAAVKSAGLHARLLAACQTGQHACVIGE